MLDTHCHINDPKFKGEVDQIVNNFLSAGVNSAICVGCDPVSNLKAKEIANTYNSVYYTVGVHPDDCEKFISSDLEEYLNEIC